MKFIDMHCDTLAVLLFRDKEKADLFDSKIISVDFKRMLAGDQLAQFFAIYLMPHAAFKMLGAEDMPDEEYIAALRKYLLDNVDKHSDIIAMAYNGDDVEKNRARGLMSAVLTMEDGRAVDGKLDNVKRFYDMGIRALSLTWNASNCFGAPNSADPQVMKTGLTPFGKDAVAYMQELGMLVDVSHLSEGGFYDVAAICKKPFVATHSNSIALCPHQRNLTDDQIRILGNTGSVTGINFGPEFLNMDISCKDSTAAVMAKHARHIANVGGIDCVGLGSDFDGVEGNLEINDCSKMQILIDSLKAEGFTENEIEKIFYRNTLRVMKESMK